MVLFCGGVQLKHVASLFEPLGHLDRYWPIAHQLMLQPKQEGASSTGLYVSPGQVMHDTDEIGAYVPAGQIKHAEDPCGEYRPPAQSVHTDMLVAAETVEYLPPKHWSHTDVFLFSAYFPAGQSIQSSAVAASKLVLYLPGGQAAQDEELTAPIMGLYHPLPHSVHVPGPSSVLYLPVLQGMHGAPFEPTYPRLQVQSRIWSLSGGESDWSGQSLQWLAAVGRLPYVPCWHDKQLDVPLACLNVPGRHSRHGPPSGPVYPGLQMQSKRETLPCKVIP